MARTREQIQADIIELNNDIIATEKNRTAAGALANLDQKDFPPNTDFVLLQTALTTIKIPDIFTIDLTKEPDENLPNIEKTVIQLNSEVQTAQKALTDFTNRLADIRKATADYQAIITKEEKLLAPYKKLLEQYNLVKSEIDLNSPQLKALQEDWDKLNEFHKNLRINLIDDKERTAFDETHALWNNHLETFREAAIAFEPIVVAAYNNKFADQITADKAEKMREALLEAHGKIEFDVNDLLLKDSFKDDAALQPLFVGLKKAQEEIDTFIKTLRTTNISFDDTTQRENFVKTTYPEGLRLLAAQKAAYNQLNAEVQKAEAATKAAKEAAEESKIKADIKTKLDDALKRCEANFNNRANPPIRGESSIRHNPSVEKAWNKFKELRQALRDKNNVVSNDPSPLDAADLEELKKQNQQVDKLIEELDPAMAAAAQAYDDAAKLIEKLQADKDALAAQIDAVTGANSPARKLLKDIDDKAIAGNASTSDIEHKSNIDSHITALAARIGLAKTMDQAQLDALKLQVETQIKELNDAVKKAGVDVYAGRLKNMDAQFSLHKEHIGRIVNGVRLIVGQQTKKGEYNDRITEINNLIADLELLKQWDKENKRTKDKDIDMGLEQLNAALYMLENPGKGIAHNAQYSEAFTIDANDKTGAPKGEKAIVAEARTHEESLLKKAGYDSQQASMSIGSLSSGPASSTAGSKYITEKFFGALKKGDKLSCSADIFVVEKGAKKSDHAIAATSHFSSSTATITSIRLSQYSEENREVMWNTGLPTLLPSLTDRQLAMKVVLSHIEKDIYRQLLEKLAILDKTTPGAAADKANKILKQIMRGDAPTEFKDLHIKPSPLFINGNLPDNYSEAIMLASDYLGVACTDSRTGPNCDIKTKVEGARRASYAFDVRDNPERYFENGTKPFFAIKAADTKKLIDEAHIQLRTKP